MEGHIYNKVILHRKKEGFARTVSHRQKTAWKKEVVERKIDEFLWMFGGAALIGTSIYILSIVLL